MLQVVVNGHALGNQDYTFGDKDDVIGSYSVSAETGLITFTPKKKYQSTRHQEYVNIGDNPIHRYSKIISYL